MADLSPLRLARAFNLRFALALGLSGGGCCLSIGVEGSTGLGQGIAGQGTSGGSDGQGTAGGSATTGGVCGLTPDPLDFGPTVIGTVANRTVTLSNCFTTAIAPLTATVGGPDPNLFGVSNVPTALEPGESATVSVSYAPQALETRSQANVTFAGPDAEKAVLILLGEPADGSPQISCLPSSIGFGQVVAHNVATLPILCINTGPAVPNPKNLLIDPPTTSPSVFSAQFDETSDLYPLNGLAPGQVAQIDVSYAPLGPANDTGTLYIKSNAGQHPFLQIPLFGESLNAPPCDFEISPWQLSFDYEPVGASQSLALDVTNMGGICLVSGPRIFDDDAGAFRIVSTSAAPDPVTGKITILASSSLTITVEFAPISAGSFYANLAFAISDPANPNQVVPLWGATD